MTIVEYPKKTLYSNFGGTEMDIICKVSGKVSYTTQREAQTIVNGARIKHWTNQAKRIPKRVYLCPFCKMWHLTKEIPENEKRRTKAKCKRRHTNERRRIEGMESVIREYTRKYQ